MVSLTACHPRAIRDENAPRVNAADHRDAPYVVLVSLDGFRFDYPDIFHTPNLDRIARAGVKAEALRPVFPVKTFPNHYSIVTGMHPSEHGLVANTMYDPDADLWYRLRDRAAVEDPRWYGGEPIWVTAAKQGMVTASFFWVGSEAPIQGFQPTYWYRFDDEIAAGQRVDQVLDWLDMNPQKRPHMITLYFEHTDHAGHDYPVDAGAMRDAVRLVDDQLGKLLEGIAELPHADQVHIIVVSDHGMADVRAKQTWYLEDMMDTDQLVAYAGSRTERVLHIDPLVTPPDDLISALQNAMPNVAVFTPDNAPDHLQYRGDMGRLGDIVLVPELGWQVQIRRNPDWELRDSRTHGWDRNSRSMHGIFYAMGPRIRAGSKLSGIENIHIYALMAELLGLKPADTHSGSIAPFSSILSER